MRRLSLALLALVPALAAQDKGNAYLGVHALDVHDERNETKVPKGVDKGVVLTHVEKGSAAERAGLRVGDILVFFDGKAVESIESLAARIGKRGAGDKVTYKVLRGTGSIEGTLTLGKRPAEMPVKVETKEPPRPERKATPERPGTDLDKRLDRVADQIEAMRRKLTGGKAKERVAPAPRNLVGWMEREEKFLVAARKRGDQKAVHFHEVRMALLREMRQAGFRAPAPRMGRIEKKLDRLIELLEKRK